MRVQYHSQQALNEPNLSKGQTRAFNNFLLLVRIHNEPGLKPEDLDILAKSMVDDWENVSPEVARLTLELERIKAGHYTPDSLLKVLQAVLDNAATIDAKFSEKEISHGHSQRDQWLDELHKVLKATPKAIEPLAKLLALKDNFSKWTVIFRCNPDCKGSRDIHWSGFMSAIARAQLPSQRSEFITWVLDDWRENESGHSEYAYLFLKSLEDLNESKSLLAELSSQKPSTPLKKELTLHHLTRLAQDGKLTPQQFQTFSEAHPSGVSGVLHAYKVEKALKNPEIMKLIEAHQQNLIAGKGKEDGSYGDSVMFLTWIMKAYVVKNSSSLGNAEGVHRAYKKLSDLLAMASQADSIPKMHSVLRSNEISPVTYEEAIKFSL